MNKIINNINIIIKIKLDLIYNINFKKKINKIKKNYFLDQKNLF